MTHDEIRESLPAFALDALDPIERDAVSAHVRSCTECQAELASLEPVVNSIGLEAAPVTPPASLRGRVLARVEQEQARSGRARIADRDRQATSSRWLPLAMAASLLLAAGGLYYAFSSREELQTLRHIARVLEAPDVITIQLKGQETASAASGRALWSAQQGLVFTADRLPALPGDRVYQLWTISGSKPISAGLLSPDASGKVTFILSAGAATARPDAFGVTIEPAGGSASPTMPIVLIGSQ